MDAYDKLMNDHLESVEKLNKESFEHSEINRDNLEDFRIHTTSLIAMLIHKLDELQKNQK